MKHRGGAPIGLALLGWLLAGSEIAASVRLQLQDDPQARDFATIELAGLQADILEELRHREPSPEQWSAMFATFPGEPGPGLPPMLGSWAVEAEIVRFRPRFPLVAGLTYTVYFDPEGLETLLSTGRAGASWQPVVARISLPLARHGEAPRVVAIYPSAALLPANLLRLYVHFSQPMHAAGVAGHVRLLNESGSPVEDAFVSIPDGLWDEEQKRWTLLMHPGRIKRGVGPRLVQGPVLQAGGRYRVVIDQAMESRVGLPLADSYVKEFSVAPADRRSPGLETWRLGLPQDPTSTLMVDFGESLDSALALRWIRVTREQGLHEVPGSSFLGGMEKSLRFLPDAPWASGIYRLEVATRLEDLAGNTLLWLFDEETRTTSKVAKSEEATSYLSFSLDFRPCNP